MIEAVYLILKASQDLFWIFLALPLDSVLLVKFRNFIWIFCFGRVLLWYGQPNARPCTYFVG